MIIIFIVASAAFYFTLNYIIVHQIDHDLEIEEGEINTYIAKHGKLPEMISVKDQLIEFSASSGPVKRHFATISETSDRKQIKLRQLIFSVRAAGSLYDVTVSKSLDEAERFVNSVWVILLITIVAVLLVTFLINRFILKKLWNPFYRSLHAAKSFRVGTDEPLDLPSTRTKEFGVMNDILETMTANAHYDYVTLKTFSENAAHEIQTPLSIIAAKLDLIIQDENLNEKQTAALKAIYDAVQRLSSLNQSLLLLVKIENRQYDQWEQVDILALLQRKLNEFQELWRAKNINVILDVHKTVLNMNADLANLLLNNLLANATQHNCEGGTIRILLNNKCLQVSNTSHEPAIPAENLFRRFYTSQSKISGNGLGLSIVKQIATSSSFTLGYQHNGAEHLFSVFWPVTAL
jgi:signal transduction histidine kinase